MSKVSSGSGSSSTVRANENDPRSDFIMAWQKEFTTSFKSEEQFVFNNKEDITISTTGSQVQVASTNNFDGIGNNIGGNTGGAADSANEGIGDVVSGIGDTIGNWFDGVVDWFKDGWASFKDWIMLGFAAILAAGLIALAIYVGGVSAEKGEEEKAAPGIRRDLVKTVQERITKTITFDINNFVNTRVQKALFGENFKDIKQKEKEGKELSFREKIGKASDKIVHFDAVDRVLNQGLQKVFLGVTSKRLNEEGFTTKKDPSGSMTDGSYRLNKSKERDFGSFRRGHTFNIIVKFDIFKTANEAMQTAVLKGTFKEINDNLYKSQKYIDNFEFKEKSKEEDATSVEDLMNNPDYEPDITLYDSVDEALFELEINDDEFIFSDDLVEILTDWVGEQDTFEGEVYNETPDTVETAEENTVEDSEEKEEAAEAVVETPTETDTPLDESISENENSEEVTDSPTTEEPAEELTEELQEEIIETLETEDGEVVVVDYDTDTEYEESNENNSEETAYEDAVELKEKMNEELSDSIESPEEENASVEDSIGEVAVSAVEDMPETLEEAIMFLDIEELDDLFEDFVVTDDAGNEQSEHQAEDFEEKSFDDQQSESPNETINEGIVGDIDQDGIVDQTDAPDEEETDDESEENEEVAEEVVEDSEDETEVFEEEQSEEHREEPTMVRQGPSED